MNRKPHMTVCILLLVFTTGGCGNPPQTRERQASSPAPDDFEKLLDVSMEELQLKTEAHKAWGPGTLDHWSIDQKAGELVFSNSDGTRAVAPAQIIGSYNTKDHSRLWAWDNPSIVDSLKNHALKVKECGESHKNGKLTTRKWIGTEDDVWAMVALAVKLCDAQVAYRGPSGSSYVLMTFGEVKITKPTGDQ